MELFLINHDYKYAAEQIMLLLFPNERPVYPEAPTGDLWASIKLTRGKKYAVASCRLRSGSKTVLGRAAVSEAAFSDPLSEARCLQRIVKKSFYRAGLALASEKPPWGSVTGVRPGKLMSVYLSAKMSDAGAKTAFMKEYDVSPERAQLCLETAKCAAKTTKTLATRDVCLYVGIPFCPTRCEYCSFAATTLTKKTDVDGYLSALEAELMHYAAETKGRRLETVYIGGGTPTALDEERLERLLCFVRGAFSFDDVKEFTVEAGRPDTITAGKLRLLKDSGVTRISVNPQTLHDETLAAIGRQHSSKQFFEAYEMAVNAGFDNINIDLIAGLPGETADHMARTLAGIEPLAPNAVTVHTLAVKRASRLRETLDEQTLADAAAVEDMLGITRAWCAQQGLLPYYMYRQKNMLGNFENVGYAKPGFEGIYNIQMMEENQTVFAAGAGAVSKIYTPHDNRIERVPNCKQYQDYVRNHIARTQG